MNKYFGVPKYAQDAGNEYSDKHSDPDGDEYGYGHT